MKDIQFKSLTKKEPLHKKQMDMRCCPHAAGEGSKKSYRCNTVYDKMMWTPSVGDEPASKFRSAQGGQRNSQRCDRRERRLSTPPPPPPQAGHPRSHLMQTGYQQKHNVQQQSLSTKGPGGKRLEQLNYGRHERIKWKELPRACDCRTEHGNVGKKLGFGKTAEELNSKPTRNKDSYKQSGYQRSKDYANQRHQLTQTNRRKELPPPPIEEHRQPRQYHFTKELPPPADGYNRKVQKHQLHESSRKQTYHRQCTKELPTTSHKQAKHEATWSRLHTEKLPQPQTLNYVGYHDSTKERCKRSEKLKKGLEHFGCMEMNENLAKMYDLYIADFAGKGPQQHKSRAAEPKLFKDPKIKPAEPKELQRKAKTFAMPTEKLHSIPVSAQDIINAKVTAPMICRVQRIYQANLEEQMKLMQELGSIPKLVKEMLENAKQKK